MKNKKIKFWQILFLIFLASATAIILNKKSNQQFYENDGLIFGTSYHIKYEATKDLGDSINKELQKVDNSLSIFNKNSVISKINDNKSDSVDNYFELVYTLAHNVSIKTNGSFDITVAPLVNTWGFGFKNAENVTKQSIDSIKQFIGYEKVSLNEHKIKKSDKRIMLDCGAIAKGFGVDCVVELLHRHNVKNLMVEIGGEVVVRGTNEQNSPWRIGVSKPVDSSKPNANEIQTILNLKDCALATSGNYRNFYYRDGKKYAHTINPKTGYPVQHNILSASVIAPTCAEADAFATSFMVMGINDARSVLNKNKYLKAYIIYENRNGKLQTWTNL